MRTARSAGGGAGRRGGGSGRRVSAPRGAGCATCLTQPASQKIPSVVQMLVFIWRSYYCECCCWECWRQRPTVSVVSVHSGHVVRRPRECLQRSEHARRLFASAYGSNTGLTYQSLYRNCGPSSKFRYTSVRATDGRADRYDGEVRQGSLRVYCPKLVIAFSSNCSFQLMGTFSS